MPRLPASRVVLLLALLLVPRASASAQTVNDGRVWTGVALQERPGTHSPWRWAVDVPVRTRDGVDAVDLTGVRPAVGYDLSARASIWAGYAIVGSFPASGGVVVEHRVFQQFLWVGAIRDTVLSLRTRLEQRSIEDNSSLSWRTRQQIRISRPIWNGSRVSFVTWDEVFFHLNTTSRYGRGLDQNRFFAGIGRPLSRKVRLEAGYANQFTRSRRGPNRMNHVLSASLGAAF